MAAVRSLMSGYINEEGVMSAPVDSTTSALIGHYVYIPQNTVVAVKSLGFTSGLGAGILGAICAADGVPGTLTIANPGCHVRLTKFSAVVETQPVIGGSTPQWNGEDSFDYPAGDLTGQGDWEATADASLTVVGAGDVQGPNNAYGSNKHALGAAGLPINGAWEVQIKIVATAGDGSGSADLAVLLTSATQTHQMHFIWPDDSLNEVLASWDGGEEFGGGQLNLGGTSTLTVRSDGSGSVNFYYGNNFLFASFSNTASSDPAEYIRLSLFHDAASISISRLSYG